MASSTVTLDLRQQEHRVTALLVWIAVGIGVLLRIWGVLMHPVDQDELYTVLESQQLYSSTLVPGIQARPLYYLIQHVLMRVIPSVEPWTRILPLAAGAAGIWLTARLARRAGGEPAGAIAAWITALSPWHIYASETARYYSLSYLCLVLLATMASCALERRSTRAWLMASFPVIVGLLTHPSFIVSAGGPLIALGLIQRRGTLDLPELNRLLWYFAPIGVGFVLLGLSIWHGNTSEGLANGTIQTFTGPLRLALAVVEWAHPLIILGGGLGIAYMMRAADDSRWQIGLLMCAMFMSTACGLLLAARLTAVYADYAIGLLLASIVGFSVGVANLVRPGRYALMAIVVGIGVVIFPSTVSQVSDGGRFDYRPAFAAVRQRDATKAVLVWPDIIARHYAQDLRRRPLMGGRAYLDSLLTAEGDVWVVSSVKRSGTIDTNDGQLREWMNRHCRAVQSFERPRFDFRQYQVQLMSCQREES